jgi:hypothetical protein
MLPQFWISVGVRSMLLGLQPTDQNQNPRGITGLSIDGLLTIEIDRFRQLLQSNNYLNQSIKHLMNQVGGMILTIDPSFKTQ